MPQNVDCDITKFIFLYCTKISCCEKSAPNNFSKFHVSTVSGLIVNDIQGDAFIAV